jgi:hypothetical protein
VSGGIQVGSVTYGSETHAALWFGTAESFVDLHSFLPSGYSYSTATGVANDGVNEFVVGTATNDITGQTEAMKWVHAVPEPGTLLTLALGGLLLRCRYRSRSRIK